jgi:hypothetical protein
MLPDLSEKKENEEQFQCSIVCFRNLSMAILHASSIDFPVILSFWFPPLQVQLPGVLIDSTQLMSSVQLTIFLFGFGDACMVGMKPWNPDRL